MRVGVLADDKSKLLTTVTVTSHIRVGLDLSVDELAHLLEYFVSLWMTIGVVDIFEVINIKHNYRVWQHGTLDTLNIVVK